MFANAVVRIVVVQGPVVDWGPPALAVVLGLVFLFLGQDPKTTGPETSTRS